MCSLNTSLMLSEAYRAGVRSGSCSALVGQNPAVF